MINGVIAEIQSTFSSSQFTVFPNPVIDKLEIRNLNHDSEISIKIFSTLGSAVQPETLPHLRSAGQAGDWELETFLLDVSQLASGIYYLQISSNEKIYRTKFIKQ